MIDYTKWRQVEGDVNPGTYGGTIARLDGDHVEVRQIQPVREYVGDGEARDVGFPFWTREACFTLAELDPADPNANRYIGDALRSCGLDLSDLPQDRLERSFALAVMLLEHGWADEGPAGWSEDVIPGPVLWWGASKPQGAEYLSDEDADFRRDVLGQDDE